MKKTAIVTALVICALPAFAQEQGRVLSSTPIVQQVGIPQQVCGNRYSARTTNTRSVVIENVRVSYCTTTIAITVQC